VALALLAGLTSCASGARSSGADFAAFLDRVDSAQRELQQGLPESYKVLWSRKDDVSLAGGFGGAFEQGWANVAKRLDWAGSQFKEGRSQVRRISSSASGNLGYVVQSEHIQFTATSSNAPAERVYRVTMLFRHEDGQWRIIHRHADVQSSKAAPQ
jgi:ketosteroid isomerase-like protein